MTGRTWVPIGRRLVPGLAAVGIFVVLAVVMLNATFPLEPGFADDSVVANIGFALINVDAGAIPAADMLAPFLAIAVLLDAALGGAIMLAWRDDEDRGDDR